MKKRIISLALAVMMVVCLLPMTALAALVAVNGRTTVDSMTYNGITVYSYTQIGLTDMIRILPIVVQRLFPVFTGKRWG